MKVRIEKDSEEYQLYVDLIQYDFDEVASRLLTNTSCEDSRGIFSKKTKIRFSRNSHVITVDFDREWNPAIFENPAEEIKARVLKVEEAFQKSLKYNVDCWTAEI